MAQVIIAENLFKADYVREQTDLPFLVRADTGRYLRAERRRRRAARTTSSTVWDEATRTASSRRPAARDTEPRTCVSGSVRAGARTARFSVKLADGRAVDVRPLLDGDGAST